MFKPRPGWWTNLSWFRRTVFLSRNTFKQTLVFIPTHFDYSISLFCNVSDLLIRCIQPCCMVPSHRLFTSFRFVNASSARVHRLVLSWAPVYFVDDGLLVCDGGRRSLVSGDAWTCDIRSSIQWRMPCCHGTTCVQQSTWHSASSRNNHLLVRWTTAHLWQLIYLRRIEIA